MVLIRTITFLANGIFFLFLVLSAGTTSGFVSPQRYPGEWRRCQDDSSIGRYLSGQVDTGTGANGESENRISSGVQCWEREAIDWIDDLLDQKSKQSPFETEASASASSASASASDTTDCSVPFEWVQVQVPGVGPSEARGIPAGGAHSSGTVALRTTGSTPLLDAESIAFIRNAAQNLWDGQGDRAPTTSRFTLQFSDTNSECHLDQLVATDASGKLNEIVDDLLTTKVYPLVRSAFGGSSNGDGPQLTDGRLCVYDSLVIRYNGDKATSRFDASQPLHRDGGVVSVNIALNPHVDAIHGEGATAQRDADAFTGGGTFFEDLIFDDTQNDDGGEDEGEGKSKDEGNGCDPILRPVATGHAVAHWSTKRHAGAPTTSGTRDILVFFLTQRKAPDTHSDEKNHPKDPNEGRFPSIERSFHLKLKAQDSPGEMALRCLNLAIKETPFDGQAHSLKGFELMRGGTKAGNRGNASTEDNDPNEEKSWLEEVNGSVYQLSRAVEYAPFDARIHCYLGMAYRQRWMFARRTQRTKLLASYSVSKSQEQQECEELSNARDSLHRALELHERYERHGISSDFQDKASLALLTIGEVSMQLERYEDALRWLSEIESRSPDEGAGDAMRRHVAKLMAHCKDQIRAETETETKTKTQLSAS